MIKEACVETLAQCLLAEENGADRVELCADLDQDGLTPSEGLIRAAKEQLTIPVRVMVRPRDGGFYYTDSEFLEMKKCADLCKEIGVEGVVFGITSADGRSLNVEKIKELAACSKPLKVTIHKAIDVCLDPLKELEGLMGTGLIDSVLTSGKAATAVEGKLLLKRMIAHAGNEIEIIACGKVTSQNISELHRELNARAYHGKKIVSMI